MRLDDSEAPEYLVTAKKVDNKNKETEEWVIGRICRPFVTKDGEEEKSYFDVFEGNGWSQCMVFADSVCSSYFQKWKYICFHAENVASEVLNCIEAQSELTVSEIKEILVWTGDDEYVYVTETGEIVESVNV